MAEKKKKKWIQGMHMKKGAMTEAAKREGVSNSEYIREHLHDSGKAGKRARLANTFKHMNHHVDHAKMREKMYGKKKGK